MHQLAAPVVRLVAVGDQREGVDRLSVYQDVELDQVSSTVTLELVIERSVTLRPRLELVVEVDDQLGQRHVEHQAHAILVQVVHLDQLAAALSCQLHDRADEAGGGQDRDARPGLADLLDLAGRGHLRWLVDRHGGAVALDDLVLHAGRRRQQVELILPLQPLLDDLHVQQAEEATAEAEAERFGGLRLEDQRGIVQSQSLQRVAQLRILVAVHWVEAGENHRLDRPVAGQRAVGRAVTMRDRVADLRVSHDLQTGCHVAHLASGQFADGCHQWPELADLQRLGRYAGGHHQDGIAGLDAAIDHLDIGDHPLVRVVVRVEDQRAEGSLAVARRGRDLADDRLQDLRDADPLFGRGEDDLVLEQADVIGDVLCHLLWHGIG